MDYAAELAAAWAAHLAPRAADAPTVVSTFAGCGGSSLGYSMAGYRELLAVEWDDHAAALFRRNFPDVPLHHGDITALDPATLSLPVGELDVLDGSPPCQGFSPAGLRRSGDERSTLYREYARLLDAWQPRAFVMENVAGLVRGKMRLVFAEMMRTLKAAGPGYQVRAQLLDASWFGVPQRRNRLIFLGVRADLGTAPAFPRPDSLPPTVRDAWRDLTSDSARIGARTMGSISERLAPLIPSGSGGKAVLEANGRKGSFYNLQRLRWGQPSFTLTSQGAWLLHPAENRLIGAREAARLQSFPDAYDWADSLPSQIINRLGNSVPPLLMRAIAAAIRQHVIEPARVQIRSH